MKGINIVIPDSSLPSFFMREIENNILASWRVDSKASDKQMEVGTAS
jgi:hypothetical protein